MNHSELVEIPIQFIQLTLIENTSETAHDLETYDDLADADDDTSSNKLATQLRQAGLRAVSAELDDFLARATKAGLVVGRAAGAVGPGRNRRTLPA